MKLLILTTLIGMMILSMACGTSVEPYPLSASQAETVKASLNETMAPDFAPLTDSEFKTLCSNFKGHGWDPQDAVDSIDADNARSRFAHQGLTVWLWQVSGDSSADAAPGLLAGFCRHMG